jgi:hypothetical protein
MFILRDVVSALKLNVLRIGPLKLIFVTCSLNYTLLSFMASPSRITRGPMGYGILSRILQGMALSPISVCFLSALLIQRLILTLRPEDVQRLW